MTFTKTMIDELLGTKYTTTIYNDNEVLRASRVIRGKLMTITTGAPVTTIDYTMRAKNMYTMADDLFILLQDQDIDELEEYE